jgi:hypothetical protein
MGGRHSHKEAQKAPKAQEMFCGSCAFLWRTLRLTAGQAGVDEVEDLLWHLHLLPRSHARGNRQRP